MKENDTAPVSMRRIIATFRPKALDTLRPEAQPFIGQRAEFRGGWLIDEEDGGPYVGQIAWLAPKSWRGCGWIPTEDLADVFEEKKP